MAAVLGMPPELVPSLSQPEEDELWPELLPVVTLFAATLTQLRVAPMGGVVGIDYQALAVVAQARGVSLSRGLLDDIAVLEQELLAQINKAK